MSPHFCAFPRLAAVICGVGRFAALGQGYVEWRETSSAVSVGVAAQMHAGKSDQVHAGKAGQVHAGKDDQVHAG